MKVVQVLPTLNDGGVEKGTLEIARALIQAGHESIVLSAGGQMVERLTTQGSQHINWDLGKKSPYTFRHIWAVRNWLKQERPDILHLRSRMPAWVLWLAWRGLPKNDRPHLVTTVHGLYSVSKYSEIMCTGERIIAVSETIYNYIRDNYPATDMSHVKLIYRGIDPAEFPYGYQPSSEWVKRWQRELPPLAGKKILTLPGRLTRLKGHHHFIDLIIKLKQAGIPVHGLIVGGEDPKRQQYAVELRKRVHIEGLDDTISFTGNLADIRDIYAISNIVLSLSTQPESFGRTVLEALSLGVPVVGYDHGGVREILRIIFPQGCIAINDSNALFNSTCELLRSNIKPKANTTFLKATMLAQTLAIYQDLLK